MRPTQPFLVDWQLSIDLSLVLNVDRSAEGHAVNFDGMNLSNHLPHGLHLTGPRCMHSSWVILILRSCDVAFMRDDNVGRPQHRQRRFEEGFAVSKVETRPRRFKQNVTRWATMSSRLADSVTSNFSKVTSTMLLADNLSNVSGHFLKFYDFCIRHNF